MINFVEAIYALLQKKANALRNSANPGFYEALNIAKDYQSLLRAMLLQARANGEPIVYKEVCRTVFQTSYALTDTSLHHRQDVQLKTAFSGYGLVACARPELFNGEFSLNVYMSRALGRLGEIDQELALKSVEQFKSNCIRMCADKEGRALMLRWTRMEADRLEPVPYKGRQPYRVGMMLLSSL